MPAEGEKRRGIGFVLSVDGEDVSGIGIVPGEDLLLEIQKWKVRQQELDELKAVVRERSATFRKYLQDMLRGPDD